MLHAPLNPSYLKETAVKLSIIVPVYNQAQDDKLKWCLDSLVNQTLDKHEMEIIAVDDASTDASFAIMQEYERQNPGFFHAIHSEVNHHQGGAKNIGLALSKGDWIGFIDADDWIVPDFYERLLNKAAKTGADMVGCDYNLTGEHSWKIGQIVPNNTDEQTGILDRDKYKRLILDTGSLVVKIYKRDIIIPGSIKLTKPHAIIRNGSQKEELPGLRVFPEDIFYEDNAISNSWMLRAKRFEYIKEPLYYYYQHESSTVHTISKKNLEDRMTAGRMLLMEAIKEGYVEDYRKEIEFQYTVLFYINTLFSAMPKSQHLKGCYGFTKKLGMEMKRTFPDFQKNEYYQNRINAEEKKLINMQMKSHTGFYIYYRLLWFYRNLRKRIINA